VCLLGGTPALAMVAFNLQLLQAERAQQGIAVAPMADPGKLHL
jgi:hypothetical protein